MRYYIIAGEASGDLHASHLIAALRRQDSAAEFRGFGGDLMAAQGLHLVRHYRDLAYMGFLQVALHLPAILRSIAQCKSDIAQWRPDALILVDYPGFNLRIARYVHREAICPVHYYILPKIWAWKEHRITQLRSHVDLRLSILPFEPHFYSSRHDCSVNYVGNPTLDEVVAFRSQYTSTYTQFCNRHNLIDSRPTIALLPGSRRAEIKANLPLMLQAVSHYSSTHNIVLACTTALNWDTSYKPIIDRYPIPGMSCLHDATFELLSHSTAALVTSGTATLETALFNVPQVVCYNLIFSPVVNILRSLLLKIPYVSLVNLIAESEVVPELIGSNMMTVPALKQWLQDILPGGSHRDNQLAGYRTVVSRLGDAGAPAKAATLILKSIQG